MQDRITQVNLCRAMFLYVQILATSIISALSIALQPEVNLNIGPEY